MKINPFIHWWVGKNLPREHIFIPSDKRPTEFFQLIRLNFRKWLIHPVKRRVAKYYLLILKNIFGIKVIAITGSAGKTTTKEMVMSILSQKSNVVASYKNIDPVYNIPTSILKCSPWTDYLVLEFGVEFIGEMDFYIWLAKPDVGIFLNIYPTHTQFFGDEKGVYEEKVKLIKSLSNNGYAILNKKDKRVFNASKLTTAEIIWFGGKGDIFAENVKSQDNLSTIYTLYHKKSNIRVRLNILGEHFVLNSLAAAAAGRALGVAMSEIKKGLENYEEPEHRMNVFRLTNGALIVDDSYNNNPSAAKATFKTFEKIAKENMDKVIVFGDMLELGSLERKAHEEIGEIVSDMNPKIFFGVGKASKHAVNVVKKNLGDEHAHWVNNESEVFAKLGRYLNKDTVILVKGSRSIGLDKLVHKLYEYS